MAAKVLLLSQTTKKKQKNLQKSPRIDKFWLGGTIVHIGHKNTPESTKTTSTTILKHNTHTGIFIFFLFRFFLFKETTVCTISFRFAVHPVPVYMF